MRLPIGKFAFIGGLVFLVVNFAITMKDTISHLSDILVIFCLYDCIFDVTIPKNTTNS